MALRELALRRTAERVDDADARLPPGAAVGETWAAAGADPRVRRPEPGLGSGWCAPRGGWPTGLDAAWYGGARRDAAPPLSPEDRDRV